MIEFVDTHCHLEYFTDDEIDGVFKNCAKENITYLQNICVDLKTFDKVASYCYNHKKVYCSVGMHPCNVAETPITVEQLEAAYLKHAKFVTSVGETGLDYFRDPQLQFKQQQKESFANHVEFARRYNKAVVVHMRGADTEFADIAQSLHKEKSFKGVMHCFTGSKETMFKMLDLGLYISISGIITFKNASELRNMVKNIPLNKLLIETDSPYLAPHPFRGKKNEPSFVTLVAKEIANIFDTSVNEVASQTLSNYFELFNIPAEANKSQS